MLSNSKYSLLVFPVVGIEPATSRWFHSEAPSNQMPYPLRHVSLLEWIFGTYKTNVSISFKKNLKKTLFFSNTLFPKDSAQ